MGSTRKSKVIKIDKNGSVRDFLTERQDGLWSVIGIKLDSKRRMLWLNSTVTSNMPGFKQEDSGRAGVFKFDLKTGKLVKKYVLENKPERHFFNDLVLNSRGDVFLTDMFGQAVYVISRERDELELFAKTNRLTDPNGIALSADEKLLFVASREGVSVFNVDAKSRSQLGHDDNVTLSGMDGLYVYGNSLIAVQNGINRIVRYYLNAKSDRVERSEIIEANHPMFMNPTTGVIVGDTFYYIANSQFGSFDERGALFPMEKLFEIVVLKAKL